MPDNTHTETNITEPKEQAGLPLWLYPLGFWITVGLLLAGLVWPSLAWLGVVSVGAVPVLAALWVAFTGWRTDPALARAAALALVGLLLVVGVR